MHDIVVCVELCLGLSLSLSLSLSLVCVCVYVVYLSRARSSAFLLCLISLSGGICSPRHAMPCLSSAAMPCSITPCASLD